MGVGWKVVTVRELSPLMSPALGGIPSFTAGSSSAQAQEIPAWEWGLGQEVREPVTAPPPHVFRQDGEQDHRVSFSRCHFFFLPVSSLLPFKSQHPPFSFLFLVVRRHLPCLKHLIHKRLRRLLTITSSVVGCCYKHPKAAREPRTRALQPGLSSIPVMTTTHHKAGTICLCTRLSHSTFIQPLQVHS